MRPLPLQAPQSGRAAEVFRHSGHVRHLSLPSIRSPLLVSTAMSTTVSQSLSSSAKRDRRRRTTLARSHSAISESTCSHGNTTCKPGAFRIVLSSASSTAQVMHQASLFLRSVVMNAATASCRVSTTLSVVSGACRVFRSKSKCILKTAVRLSTTKRSVPLERSAPYAAMKPSPAESGRQILPPPLPSSKVCVRTRRGACSSARTRNSFVERKDRSSERSARSCRSALVRCSQLEVLRGREILMARIRFDALTH